MTKTRKIDVLAAEINNQWQVIVNMPEVNKTIVFQSSDALTIADGLIKEGIAYKTSALPLVEYIEKSLLAEVGRVMRKMARYARQANLNRSTGELEDGDCSCVLPEQSCPTCRASARKVYSPNGEIPYQ